jgi:type II secretory pathway component PulF
MFMNASECVVSILGVLLIGIGVFLVVILVLKRRKRKRTQVDNSNIATTLIETTTKQASQTGLTTQTQLLETSRTFA